MNSDNTYSKLSDFENVVMIGMSDHYIIYKATIKDDESLYLVLDKMFHVLSNEECLISSKNLDDCTRYIHNTDNSVRWIN